MSLITDMVVHAGIGEEEAIGRLNAWCAENDSRGQQFQRLDTDAAGGFKVFTNEVWAMAGNYFPHEKLIEAFPTFGWRMPEYAVLIVDYEHAACVRVYRAAPEREDSRW